MPPRSPSIDLLEYFDAVEELVTISTLRQTLAERDPQHASGAGASTPGGEYREDNHGSAQRGHYCNGTAIILILVALLGQLCVLIDAAQRQWH